MKGFEWLVTSAMIGTIIAGLLILSRCETRHLNEMAAGICAHHGGVKRTTINAYQTDWVICIDGHQEPL
jgi:hypothetical protein